MFEKNPVFHLKHNNFRVGKVFKERFFLHQFAAVNAKLIEATGERAGECLCFTSGSPVSRK